MFLSGESYAGFYIPWIAEHIVSAQLVKGSDDSYRRDTTLGIK